MAYDSDDAGTTQVYVQSFPPGSNKFTLSTSGGYSPHWSADGRRITYITDGYHLMSVDVTVTGETLHASVPRELLTQPRSNGNPRYFASDRDLKRFLVPVQKTVTAQTPLTVVLNWSAALGGK